jgi:sulfur-oxidizing protein SoxA
MKRTLVVALPLAAALVATAQAESPTPEPADVLRGLIEKSGAAYLSQSEQNLMMMADNPANWTIDEGKALFHTKRGPKNASMEGCDFGKGPGVLKGAYVELPRYFADTGKVMDLEGRIMHCMMTLQGFKADDPEVKKHHGSDSDQMKLQAYITAQSNGMPWNPPLDHPLEKAMRDAGEVIFNRRAGTMDFSCSSCHTEDAKRIRASVLPNVGEPMQWTKAISWPAFRAGQDNLRSSQHRLSECYWQMRQAEPIPASDATVAIISFWTDKARGQPAILPDMKR